MIMYNHGFVSSLPRVVFSGGNCDDLGSCNCNEAWEVVRLVKNRSQRGKSSQDSTRGRRLPTRQAKDERKIRKLWNGNMECRRGRPQGWRLCQIKDMLASSVDDHDPPDAV